VATYLQAPRAQPGFLVSGPAPAAFWLLQPAEVVALLRNVRVRQTSLSDRSHAYRRLGAVAGGSFAVHWPMQNGRFCSGRGRAAAARSDLLLGPYFTVLRRAADDMAAKAGWPVWNHGGSGDDVETAHPVMSCRY
jgi:hypothetical protein